MKPGSEQKQNCQSATKMKRNVQKYYRTTIIIIVICGPQLTRPTQINQQVLTGE